MKKVKFSFIKSVSLLLLSLILLTACGGGSEGAFSSSNNMKELLSVNITAKLTTRESSKVSIYDGGKLKLVAEGVYTDGSKENLSENVIWNSASNETINIDSNGVLTGISTGKTEVHAVYKDIKSNVLSVTVTDAILVSLEATPDVISVPKGTEIELRALGHLSDNSTMDVTSSVEWRHSSAGETLSRSRFIEQVPGRYEVFASLEGIDSNVVDITVVDIELDSIVIEPSASIDLYKNVPRQLTAVGNYADGSTRDISDIVKWSSTAPEVATVSEAGQLSYADNGSTVISAQLEDKSSNMLNVTSKAFDIILNVDSIINPDILLTDTVFSLSFEKDGVTQNPSLNVDLDSMSDATFSVVELPINVENSFVKDISATITNSTGSSRIISFTVNSKLQGNVKISYGWTSKPDGSDVSFSNSTFVTDIYASAITDTHLYTESDKKLTPTLSIMSYESDHGVYTLGLKNQSTGLYDPLYNIGQKTGTTTLTNIRLLRDRNTFEFAVLTETSEPIPCDIFQLKPLSGTEPTKSGSYYYVPPLFVFDGEKCLTAQ